MGGVVAGPRRRSHSLQCDFRPDAMLWPTPKPSSSVTTPQRGQVRGKPGTSQERRRRGIFDDCDGPLRQEHAPRGSRRSRRRRGRRTRNGDAPLSALRSAGSDRLPRCRPSARDVGSAIGERRPAPHGSQMGRAEEAREGRLRLRRLSRERDGSPSSATAPATVVRPHESVKSPSSDPYEELTSRAVPSPEAQGATIR
jgi:hypothetical protein